MVISPNDFSLWARLTGNKYPSTPEERAKKGPEVQNFIQNLDKEGMLGGKEPEQPKKEKNLAEVNNINSHPTSTEHKFSVHGQSLYDDEKDIQIDTEDVDDYFQ